MIREVHKSFLWIQALGMGIKKCRPRGRACIAPHSFLREHGNVNFSLQCSSCLFYLGGHSLDAFRQKEIRGKETVVISLIAMA